MVEFPTSFSQHIGQRVAGAQKSCRLEHSVLLWLLVALGLVTVTYSMLVSLDCLPIPHFYSQSL